MDDDELELPAVEPLVTDEYIRSLIRLGRDIYELHELKEDDSAFRLRTFSILKHGPHYDNGWTWPLQPTSRFYKRWFDLSGVRGWAIIFRIHDADEARGPEELMPGWVPPEREQDADRWIAVLNAEIRDRLQGKNHPLGPYSDPAVTDAKLRFLLKGGGGYRLYSIKEHDDRLALLALRISKLRPEFMIDGRTWRPLRPESHLYKRWFEFSDVVDPARGWALIFRMFDPPGTPTEPYEYFVGFAPPEKEHEADRWIERINGAIEERLQGDGRIVQEEIPRNERIGRRLANGRFEVTEWIGPDFLMGIAIARDEQGRRVRLTFAGDVSRSADELRPILAREIAGLAPVLYLGATAADDRWASGSMMMAELLPRGEPLDLLAHGGDAKYVATFGARLCGLVASVHANGTVLGTLRPESTFVTADGDVELVARGERLWHMPRPNMMRSTMLSPFPSGYLAPELLMKPMPNDPDPAADVFSIGVMLATCLLGQPVYEEQIDPRLFVAQMQGNHLPLPATALGELLARCLRPDPAARPSVVELEQALRAASP